MEEVRHCELCGGRCGRIAAIWIEGRGNLLVCIGCADEFLSDSKHPSASSRLAGEGERAERGIVPPEETAIDVYDDLQTRMPSVMQRARFMLAVGHPPAW